LIGRTLGKYRIIEHLGSGGMAEVYKAYHPGLDRYVAIKVLHSFLADEEDFLTRFRREARVVAMLRHPNIIQVYDFDFDAETNAYYMVMEFIDGPTLKARLQEMARQDQILPLEEAVHIVTAVASALDYAHQRGMVHRDVKPANIMFTQDGQVILTDFGIAKMVNTTALTASGRWWERPRTWPPSREWARPGMSEPTFTHWALSYTNWSPGTSHSMPIRHWVSSSNTSTISYRLPLPSTLICLLPSRQ